MYLELIFRRVIKFGRFTRYSNNRHFTERFISHKGDDMNVTLVTRRNGLGILGYLFTKTIRHHDVSAMTTSFSGILQIVSYCGPKMEKSITTYQISDVLKLHVTSE